MKIPYRMSTNCASYRKSTERY